MFLIVSTMTFSTLVVYAATYNLSQPITTSSIAYGAIITTNYRVSLVSQPADYTRICVTPYYTEYNTPVIRVEQTKYVGSGNSRVESLVGTVSYPHYISSQRRYTKLIQVGQEGIYSSGNAYRNVTQLVTNF